MFLCFVHIKEYLETTEKLLRYRTEELIQSIQRPNTSSETLHGTTLTQALKPQLFSKRPHSLVGNMKTKPIIPAEDTEKGQKSC